MPGRLDLTDEAIADLDAARRWLFQPGAGPRARKRMAEIWGTIDRLASNPYLYPVGAYPGVHEASCAGGYRVLYQITPDFTASLPSLNVMILRVYGPGQDRAGFRPG